MLMQEDCEKKELGLCVSEQGQLAKSFDQSHKTSGSIKRTVFPDWLKN